MEYLSPDLRSELEKKIFPNGRPEVMGSQELYDEDPIDWSVSRRRLLNAALLRRDEQQAFEIIRDYGCIIGVDKAVQFYLICSSQIVEMALEDEAFMDRLENRR